VTAFLAGLISFLSPCVLPLVPGYVSYVSGQSLETLQREHDARVRRAALGLGGIDVHEVILDGAFLMSSLNTDTEVALADLALEPMGGRPLDVVVGGLGLGYTARAALARRDARSVAVIEYLPEVIDWHRQGLVPLGDALATEARCALVAGDFFAWVGGESLPAVPDQADAVLVDIDHSPEHLLHASHGRFYTEDGLRRLARRLRPGGAFALWSADPPPGALRATLEAVFAAVEVHAVPFRDPLFGRRDEKTVVVARL